MLFITSVITQWYSSVKWRWWCITSVIGVNSLSVNWKWHLVTNLITPFDLSGKRKTKSAFSQFYHWLTINNLLPPGINRHCPTNANQLTDRKHRKVMHLLNLLPLSHTRCATNLHTGCFYQCKYRSIITSYLPVYTNIIP